CSASTCALMTVASATSAASSLITRNLARLASGFPACGGAAVPASSHSSVPRSPSCTRCAGAACVTGATSDGPAKNPGGITSTSGRIPPSRASTLPVPEYGTSRSPPGCHTVGTCTGDGDELLRRELHCYRAVSSTPAPGGPESLSSTHVSTTRTSSSLSSMEASALGTR